MIKLLCKWFNLIPKKKIGYKLSSLLYTMTLSQYKLKEKYDTKQMTEWTFYKKLWKLRGRLQMLEELIDTLK